MASSNLGRVQGGGFFGSTATSTTSIDKTTVQTNGVSPLVGDSIINANGDVCRIGAITSTAYTVTKYGSIKGATGAKGTDGTPGARGADGSDGSDGTDGATWLSGSSTPSGSAGKAGDFYLNTSTWDVYKKNSGSWSLVGNIKGASGGAKYYFHTLTDGATINKKIDLSMFGDNVVITVYATVKNREACDTFLQIKSGSVSRSINGGDTSHSYLSVLFVRKNLFDVVYDSTHDVPSDGYKTTSIDRNDFTISFGVTFTNSSDECNLLIKVEEVRAL